MRSYVEVAGNCHSLAITAQLFRLKRQESEWAGQFVETERQLRAFLGGPWHGIQRYRWTPLSVRSDFLAIDPNLFTNESLPMRI